MSKFDFYAPYPYPQCARGYLYGVAAMNKRVSDAGGLNNLAVNLIQVGFQAAVKATARKQR